MLPAKLVRWLVRLGFADSTLYAVAEYRANARMADYAANGEKRTVDFSARCVIKSVLVGRPRNTIPTKAVGWHLPIELARAVRSAALEQGVGPGVIVTRVLEEEIATRGISAFGAQRPITATELAERIRYPENFS